MPTYEYACKSCSEHVEVVQSFKDDALTDCPNCQGELRKVFGNIGIAFKGSGFYKTDSRSKSSKASAAKSGDGKSGDGKSGDGKSSGDSGKSESKSDATSASRSDATSATKSESKSTASAS